MTQLRRPDVVRRVGILVAAGGLILAVAMLALPVSVGRFDCGPAIAAVFRSRPTESVLVRASALHWDPDTPKLEEVPAVYKTRPHASPAKWSTCRSGAQRRAGVAAVVVGTGVAFGGTVAFLWRESDASAESSLHL